jgi:Coat F domain.
MPQSGLSERELLADLMSQEKQLLGATTATLQESACPQLRKLLINQFHQASMDQYELLDQMRQKGYYPDKEASGAALRQAMISMKSVQSELS